MGFKIIRGTDSERRMLSNRRTTNAHPHSDANTPVGNIADKRVDLSYLSKIYRSSESSKVIEL